MTYFTQIRAGLASSVLLLTTALASQSLAETLPEISPRQIASDVELIRNPETGASEYVAPSFDPFEEDRSLAGTASLRSVSAATTIDGQTIRGGALLDMSFYYNSASNDPYDTRGYEDAAYLSGEYAPVLYRDNRILECNEHVQDVVYYHEDYYRPSLYVNFFRPYRHYAGHHRFNRFYDLGYGYNRGYSGALGYSSRRSFGTSNRTRSRNTNRNRSRNRNRNRNSGSALDRVTDRAIARARGTGERSRRADRTDAEREAIRDRRRENRANRANRTNEGETRRRNSRRAETRNTETRRAERNLASRGQTRATAARRGAATSRPAPAARATPSTPKAGAAPRNRTIKSAPRTAPRAQRTERSQPARTQRKSSSARQSKSNRSSQRSSSTRSRSTSRSSTRSTSGRSSNRGINRSKLKLMSFLPMASAWSRNVVRNVDVQCAREEILSLHIPQERLDAARFDGLTILVLDRAGHEVPVFIPPNYIEGFRQAVNGRVTPNVSYQEPARTAPEVRAPIYQEPRSYGVEQAPCPVGTTKQSDGTCLQGGTTSYGGYPTR